MFSLGGRIRYFRTKRGYTQRQLAAWLGVTSQAVSKWETDAACPDVSILYSLACRLGVTTDQLLSPVFAGEEENL